MKLDARAVDAAAAAVRTLTGSLVQAALAGKSEAVDRALSDRELALGRLQRLFESEEIDEATRRRVAEEISLDAGEAESALRRLVKESRSALDELRSVEQAFRGYDTYRAAPSALDRSG